MLLEHAHQPGRFDPGHRRDCARETDLLDHYWITVGPAGPPEASLSIEVST
jgi:hypothetical protein